MNQVESTSIEEHLLNYEQKTVFKNFKFGVLFVPPGVTEEDELYDNNVLSPDFCEFLDFLGSKISLEGWTNFTGGLDVTRE